MKRKVFIFVISILLLFVSCFFIKSNKSDKIILQFSSWGSQSEVEVIKSVIADYEKENPKIKIDFLHIPQNYYQKLHLLFASGLEPDVLFINNQNIKLYTEAGLLTDVTPYFKNTENVFYAEALNCFRDGEHLYAIPRDISNLVLYYNKDILRQSGINKFPDIKNIDELKDFAVSLTNTKHWGINFEEEPLWWLYYLASNGGGVISDDKKSIIINNEKSLYALNLYADLVNKYHCMPSKAQIGSMTTAQMFINGKLAMYLGGRWMVPKFRETIKFDWDIAEFPADEENRVYIDASGWAISKKSKHKEEAVEFIKYLSSKSAIDKFAQSGLIVPSRIDSAKGEGFIEQNKKPENTIAFIDMLKKAKPTPVNKKYSAVNDILKEKSQCIFNGTCRAEDAFNEKTVKELEGLL